MENNKIYDGGSAFPLATGPCNNHAQGMSLRDWFAGMALQGIMGNRSLVDTFSVHEAMAKKSYFLADAMLAARKESA